MGRVKRVHSRDLSKLLVHSLSVAILVSCVLGAAAAPNLVKRAQPQGVDVSSHQGNVAWASVAASGVEFAYVKATEGTCTTLMGGVIKFIGS
jgi:hypothetical protein